MAGGEFHNKVLVEFTLMLISVDKVYNNSKCCVHTLGESKPKYCKYISNGNDWHGGYVNCGNYNGAICCLIEFVKYDAKIKLGICLELHPWIKQND